MTDKEALLEALEALHYCEALNRDVDERKMQAITVVRKLWAEHAMREVQRLGQEIEQVPDKYLYRVDVSRRKDNTCTEHDHPIYFHSKADANNYCWTINQAPYPRNTIVVAKFVDIKIAPPPPQRTEQEPVAWQWLGSAHFRKKLPKNADITAWNPLYTLPPQRKPLTDKAITKVIDSMPKKMKGFGVDWDLYEFARAIEAKPKENT